MKLIGCILTTLFCQILAEEGSAADSTECIPGTWVPASNGDYPRGAFAVGYDGGRTAYLIRVNEVIISQDGWKIPGNLYEGVASALSYHALDEFSNYEVFCGSDDQWRWRPWREGEQIPSNALIVDKNCLSNPTNVGRAHIEDFFSAGRIEDGVLYTGYRRQAYKMNEGDILVEESGADLPECVPGTWVSANNGSYPRGALALGVGMYLIRGVHKGEPLIGKLHEGLATVPKAYGVPSLPQYEVFCSGGGSYSWVPYREEFPQNAVIAGRNRAGGPVYVCRRRGADDQPALSVGKLQDDVCLFEFDGRLIAYLQGFDILVEVKSS